MNPISEIPWLRHNALHWILKRPSPPDHPLIALNLLVFALETAVTTLTCVVDTADWAAYSASQRQGIYSLYLPYLILGESSSSLRSVPLAFQLL